MRRGLVVVMVALAVLTGCTGAAGAPPVPPVGVHQDIHFEQDRLPAMLDRLRDTGLTWVRFQVLWENIQPDGPDAFNWDQYDDTFEVLRGSDVQLIGVLNGAPPWARTPGCDDGGCPPADPARFAAFARAVAERYGSQVQAWEVWNEPNLDTAWGTGPDARAYTRLLRATYPALKAADPTATVVSAGLSPAGYEEGVSVDPVGYLAAMYDAGAAGSFDALGWHPYIDPATLGRYDPQGAWSQMQDTPVSARSLMRDHGDGDKQIWATEFGVPTGPANYPDGVQADVVATSVRAWSSFDFAGPFIVFNFRDKPTDPSDRQHLYGLVRADGAPKPVVGALRQVIVGGP